jgi:hypothetical protein
MAQVEGMAARYNEQVLHGASQIPTRGYLYSSCTYVELASCVQAYSMASNAYGQAAYSPFYI